MKIIELLKRADLSKPIQEVIQVDQVNEQNVWDEITEYVVTRQIRDHFERLLRAMADAPTNPDEAVGVWISGFFGSGKSSFAKILGYALSNPEVKGVRAVDLFKKQVDDRTISDLLDTITARIPTEVVMFDISKDHAKGPAGQASIAPVLYKVLLRHLGYAEDFDIAEMEITLEQGERLDEFIRRYDERYSNGNPQNGWQVRGRSGSEVWNRVGAILHEMDRQTYPSPDSFAHGLAAKRIQVSPNFLVERSFDLMKRRRPGKALAFVVDEVGQYVAYSQDRLEDLRAVVEAFGRESRNRVLAKRAIAPTWLIVTSQEKLDEVTSAMGDTKRTLLAKVQDRFRYHHDLSPADIREVATRRVLSKTDSGTTTLKRLYDEREGVLTQSTRLERTGRKSNFEATEFAEFYPYLPHYIDLSIDIVSGIRLQPGALRHVGGSNRTIISQIYQMLTNERTHYAIREVGALVTLDKVWDLIEGIAGSEKQRDVADIQNRYGTESWEVRVARVVALLEFVRDLPRTIPNVAAMLVANVGDAAPIADVQRALKELEAREFVRETDQGFKLLTTREKRWAEERKKFREPKPRDRMEIQREVLRTIFIDRGFSTFTAKGKSFSVGVTMEDARVTNEGQIALTLMLADSVEELPRKTDMARTESRQPARQNQILWVVPLSEDIHTLVTELYASRQMLNTYGNQQSRNQIADDDSTSLAQERHDEQSYARRLADKMKEALAQGQGLFRGANKEAPDTARNAAEILKTVYEDSILELYPKLEMGVRSLKGNEADEILRAANLTGLPILFYGGNEGLGLVVKQGDRSVIDANAPVATEILTHLRKEQAFGNRVTGKDLERVFTGIGYGWDLDVVRVIAATLLRANALEVTHQGKRYRTHADPQSRAPFATTPAFRNAGFAARDQIGLPTLISAVKNLEVLTGEEADVEESAIALSLKKWAEDEQTKLTEVLAQVRANRLPGESFLEEYRQALFTIRNSASDDAVRIIANEGSTLRGQKERARTLRLALERGDTRTVLAARRALEQFAPVVHRRANVDTQITLTTNSEQIAGLLNDESLYENITTLQKATRAIETQYQQLYVSLHQQRYEVYADALRQVESDPSYVATFPPSSEEVPAAEQTERENQRAALLEPLTARMCRPTAKNDAGEFPDGYVKPDMLIPIGEIACTHCRATIPQIETDLLAVSGILETVLRNLRSASAPDKPVKRVRARDYFRGTLDSPEAIDAAVEGLRTELTKLLAVGVVIVVE